MEANWGQSLKTKMVLEAQKRPGFLCRRIFLLCYRRLAHSPAGLGGSCILSVLCGISPRPLRFRFTPRPDAFPSTRRLLCYRFHMGGSSLVARKIHGRAGADVLWAESGGKSREGLAAHRRGRRERCAGSLPARTFPDTVFLPTRRSRSF